ncbi:MAG: hypothetical protein PHG64_05105 [Paludibacter sp.]|nr:hypothetical protein [Paludibacter sp.]
MELEKRRIGFIEAIMIKIIQIQDNELNSLLQKFEEAMTYVQNLDYPIKLSSYGYFLRLALNEIQCSDLDYLLTRLKNNKDLEKNEGGYTLDFLAENNPKTALIEVIKYIKNNLPKTRKIKSLVFDNNSFLIADQNNLEFLKQSSFRKTLSIREFKARLKSRSFPDNSNLYFYLFNGQKDFDFLYNLPYDINLVLYSPEQSLYEKQFQNYKQELEKELNHNDRYRICGIKYEPIISDPIRISPTLDKIIQRLDERSQTAYNGYLNENDSLLDELDYIIQYEVAFTNKHKIVLDSNETVFDQKNNLVRARNLKSNDQIRIYPKELADNLMQIAVDSEPEIYGKVLEHSEYWLNVLEKLDKRFDNREFLYRKLKEAGLKVQSNTVDAYFKGHRKYPMYNSDIRAILVLGGEEDLVKSIIKSKRLYNSTSIALGRGLKQELKQFLQENTLGEILTKRNFSPETLSRFIMEKMPLLTISEIKEKEEENEY